MKPALFLAALFACAPAFAEGRAGVLSLQLTGSAAQPLGTKWVKENSKLGPGYGGAVLFGLSDRLEAALSYDSMRMYKTRQVAVEPVLFSLVHHYDLGGGWSPAARIGAGMANVRNARPDRVPVYGTLAVRAGVGVEYKLCSRSSAGLWADYLLAARSTRDTREVHAATVGLSLSFHAGEVQPRSRTSLSAAAAAPAPAEPAQAAKAAPADGAVFDPFATKSYAKDLAAKEKAAGRLYVWDGMKMVPAPDGFKSPLTAAAVMAGYRPALVAGKVEGACNGTECVKRDQAPDYFEDAKPAAKPARVKPKAAPKAAGTPAEVQAPPAPAE